MAQANLTPLRQTYQKGTGSFWQVLSGQMPQSQQLDRIVMTPQVEQASASDVQSEQVGMKKARHRPSGHALP
ncbi:hypothetical protein ABG982_10150, partial [Collinsella aerofaciens]|uniref:hypothetical protein n=2 Tax=Coriobacteriaceae TaxID=84107 RepID=UPI00325BC65A